MHVVDVPYSASALLAFRDGHSTLVVIPRCDFTLHRRQQSTLPPGSSLSPLAIQPGKAKDADKLQDVEEEESVEDKLNIPPVVATRRLCKLGLLLLREVQDDACEGLEGGRTNLFQLRDDETISACTCRYD